MRIVFFGSDDFALAYLKTLVDKKCQVVGCVTQPDKARDRGMKVKNSIIKEYALKKNIPVYQPTQLKTDADMEILRNWEADLFVVIAYGRILSRTVLDIPVKASINVHGSILPKYRGAAPINWAIINGEKSSGISIIKMNEKMDAGDVLSIWETDIKADDTSESLRARMMKEGPSILMDTINNIDEKLDNAIVQNESEATYASKITPALGEIDWAQDAQVISNTIRGLMPRPNAHTFYKSKRLKVISASLAESALKGDPGTVGEISKNTMTVVTAKGALIIQEVQLESSKRMDAGSFARGQRLEVGHKLPS